MLVWFGRACRVRCAAAVFVCALSACALERGALAPGEAGDPDGVDDGDGAGASSSPGGPGTPTGAPGAGVAPGDDGMASDPASGPGAGAGDGDGDGAGDGTPTEPGAAVDEPPEPTFGHSCGGVTCPSVPAPADQCCVGVDDVQSRRARNVGACGIARASLEGCQELEQPGVIDEACPALTPKGATTAEAGCCTDQGRCGTFDAANGIGCHENPAVDEPCGQDLIDEATTCDALGYYAIQARVDVTWGGRSGGLFDITDDGRGKIEVLLLASVEKLGAGDDFLGNVRACATRLPPFFSSILCESYQPRFPDVIWDSASAPRFDITGHFQCRNPGCILTMDPVTALVGIELDDPDGPWPTAAKADSFICPSGKGEACFPDQDDDGHPGITVDLTTSGASPAAGDCPDGYDYRAAPLNANPFAIIDGVVRADRLHLGVRIRLGASARLGEDCTRSAGLGGADFVQSRAASCMLEPGSANLFELPAGDDDACSKAETSFMNENLPIYDILHLGDSPRGVLDVADDSASEGTRYQMVRLGGLGEGFDCGDVRASF